MRTATLALAVLLLAGCSSQSTPPPPTSSTTTTPQLLSTEWRPRFETFTRGEPVDCFAAAMRTPVCVEHLRQVFGLMSEVSRAVTNHQTPDRYATTAAEARGAMELYYVYRDCLDGKGTEEACTGAAARVSGAPVTVFAAVLADEK